MDDYRGEEFLNKKNPNLHMSEEIMHSALKSDSPKEKIRRYLDRLERITKKAMDEDRATHENDRALLRKFYYRKYVIKKENVPASYFELQEKIAHERGLGYLRYDEETKNQEIEQIISEQKHSLDKWLDYFESEDTNNYPMWFKYYAFQGMVKLGGFDKGKERYSKRTDSTVKPFVELDREALAMVYDEMSRFLNNENIEDEELKLLLEGGNFGKLYSDAIKRIDSVLKDDTKSDEGIWKKYEQGSDPNMLFNDIYGKGTGWCTAGSIGMADTHLSEGDFYVYYTKDRKGEFTCPRIAIRKKDGEIAEIRGIEANQNIESNMESVVSKKLEEPEFPDRDEYKRKVEDMQMMTYIHTKWKMSGKLDERDLKFLYEIERPIIGFGYSKDPRIKEIIEKRDKKADVALLLGIDPKEVSTNSRTALTGKYSIHQGDLDLPAKISDCVVPTVVGGTVNFSEVEQIKNVSFGTLFGMTSIFLGHAEIIKDVKFPDNIEKLCLRGAVLEGNISFPANLRYLEIGRAGIDLSKVKFPSQLEKLEIKSFDESKGISGLPASLKHIEIYELENLSSIQLPPYLQTLSANVKSIKGVEFPESITDIELWGLSTLDGVKLPPNLTSLVLYDLKDAKELGELSSCLRKLYIDSVENVDGLVFPDGLEELDISSVTDIHGIKLPMSLQDLVLSSVRSLEEISLPLGLKSLAIDNLSSLNDIELPPNLKSLTAKSVRDVTGVEFPSSLISLDLHSVENLDGIHLPPNLENLDAGSLRKASSLILPEKLKVVDLKSLESVEHLVLPKHPMVISLPITMDFSCIEAVSDKKTQETILTAIEEGYFQQGYEDREIKTAMTKLKKHFVKATKQTELIRDTTKNSPSVGKQKEEPRILSVPKKAIISIKEKTEGTIHRVVSTTKEKLQELKEILIYGKRNIDMNGVDNQVIEQQVAEENIEGKRR